MVASPAHSDATACTTTITTTTVDASALGSSLDFGKMEYGCKHYRRRCMIRAPCCNEVFTCRHCHNESVADRHELPRHDVQRVICLVCDAEQPPAQVCSNCAVNMGEYFCDICKFYDDDTEKRQYHCNDCGICRVGGRENFFHCQKCGSCYSVHLRNKHPCVENSMRRHCPICYEYLFDSLKETRVLKCGHTMHWGCLNEMLKHDQYGCPTCSKSVIDMSRIPKKLDEETHQLDEGNQDVQDEAHLGDAEGGLQQEEMTLEFLSAEVNQIRTSLEALTLKVDSTHQSFLEYRQEFHQFMEDTFGQNLWDQLAAHSGGATQ